MTETTTQPASRIFYGWVVVAAAFAITFVGFGSAYTFSAFVDSLQRDFGASRGSVSLVFSIAGFLYFGFGVVSGPLSERWGARSVGIVGMLLVGAGLMLAGFARSLAQVYLAYGLGVGLGLGMSYVPVLGTVQRWFVRRRGLASGLAVSGIGVGTLVMPPLALWLISAFGWRNAYFWLGGLAIIAGVSMASLIRKDPQSMGLLPDADVQAPNTPAASAIGATSREATRSKEFAALYAACLICAFGVFVPFAHLVPSAIDHGIEKSAAVLLIGVIGIGSTAGRFLLGDLADRLGRRNSLIVAYGGMAAALCVWAASSSFWWLAAFSFVFGVFNGGWVAVLPSVVADTFGGRNVSAIIGALYTSVAIGTLIGPTAAGYAFDWTGSYVATIAVAIAGNIIAALIMAVTTPRKVKL
jgi:MFS transporter, OFA family, oxalate/formate antiporter